MWRKPLYILVMKNPSTRLTHVEKFSADDFVFPTRQLAEDRGQELIKLTKDDKPIYTGFHTMELNYFISTMIERWGIFPENKKESA